MRVDSINLIGTFSITGNFGTEGQILAYTGSQISWITPVASGGFGETGPQGITGPGSLNIPVNRIVFGCVGASGATSSEFFLQDPINQTFILGRNHTSNSGFSSILGGCGSTQSLSSHTAIITGQNHTQCKTYYSFIGGGQNNSDFYYGSGAQNKYNTLMGGSNNIICAGKNSSIIGGSLNSLHSTVCKCRSTIMGGANNCITSISYANYQTSIIAGNKNCSFSMRNSSIIGGNYNLINNPGSLYCNSVMIGGCSMNLNHCNSVIVGGCAGSDPNAQDGVLNTPNSVMIGGGPKNSAPIIFYSMYHNSTFADCLIVKNNLRLFSYYNDGIRNFSSGHPDGIFFLKDDKGVDKLTIYINLTKYTVVTF